MNECKFESLIDEYLLDKLSEEDKARFEEHYFSCPSCFQALQERDDLITAIKSQGHELFADLIVGEQIRKVSMWERLSGFLSPGQWVTAAVSAALVLVIALSVIPRLKTQSPTFFLDDQQTRGTSITLISDSIPGKFQWQSVDNAAEYKIYIDNHDPLWNATTQVNFISLPEEIKAKMKPGVQYFWQVKAFSQAGTLIAVSSKIQFSIPK